MSTFRKMLSGWMVSGRGTQIRPRTRTWFAGCGIRAGMSTEAVTTKAKPSFVFGVVNKGDESNLVFIPEPQAQRISAIYNAISATTGASLGN